MEDLRQEFRQHRKEFDSHKSEMAQMFQLVMSSIEKIEGTTTNTRDNHLAHVQADLTDIKKGFSELQTTVQNAMIGLVENKKDIAWIERLVMGAVLTGIASVVTSLFK